MTSADDVARYLIWLGQGRGMPINNAQLQRLLYYVQAWHLAARDEPLFEDKFQAWIYGPVLPRLYWTYDVHGWQPLPCPAVPPALRNRDAAFVREIADDYLGLDEWELEDLACSEDPWLNARSGVPRVDPSGAELSEDDMRIFYREVAEVA